MATSPAFSPGNALISFLSLLVFTCLDLLDLLLCYFYRFVDGILENKPIPCYCHNREKQGSTHEGGKEEEEEEEEISETLYGRRNIFREIGLLHLNGGNHGREEKDELSSPRWSDCCCRSCVSWQEKGVDKLHLVVKEPTRGVEEASSTNIENVIFLHGFLSSSSLWTETVFPNLSEEAKQKFRMFAVDLLGFGESPKPMNCMYRIKDHVGKIEKSVFEQFQLKSYHLVAHSMGCIIALALAAKHPQSVKSVTLIAPPYFAATEKEASFTALNKLAERTIWPPLLFGSSIMSWYEHLGRTICFIFCRNHLAWEALIKLLTRRDLDFLLTDFTKHTHHSAWHTMHNVICGGVKQLDKHLEAVRIAGIPVKIVQGNKDKVVPLECSYNLNSKLPLAELKIINDADHRTVITGREKVFTRDLEEIWFNSSKAMQHEDMRST